MGVRIAPIFYLPYEIIPAIPIRCLYDNLQ